MVSSCIQLKRVMNNIRSIMLTSEVLCVSVIGLQVVISILVRIIAFGEQIMVSTSAVGMKWKSAQLHCRLRTNGTKQLIFLVNQHLEIGPIKHLMVGQSAMEISMGSLY